jgi:membrane protease YdiL (CAAX protease family)
MFLKYNCPNCGYEIITKYLKPGDNLTCKACNSEITVPADAIETDEGPTFFSKSNSENPPDIDWGNDPNLIEVGEITKLPTPWGVSDIIWFIVAYIIGAICLVIILMPIAIALINIFIPGVKHISISENPIYNSNYTHFLSIITDVFAIGIIYYFVVLRHKNNFYNALGLNKPGRGLIFRYSKIAFIIFILTAMAGVIVHYSPLAKYIPKHMPIHKVFQSYGELIWATILAQIAPIPEEIIFRGFIFIGLRNKLGTIWAAIIVTGLFVYVHGHQLSYSLIDLIILLIGAIWVMVVRIKTNSLTNCILIHFFYNLFISIMIWTAVLAVGHLPLVD